MARKPGLSDGAETAHVGKKPAQGPAVTATFGLYTSGGQGGVAPARRAGRLHSAWNESECGPDWMCCVWIRDHGLRPVEADCPSVRPGSSPGRGIWILPGCARDSGANRCDLCGASDPPLSRSFPRRGPGSGLGLGDVGEVSPIEGFGLEGKSDPQGENENRPIPMRERPV